MRGSFSVGPRLVRPRQPGVARPRGSQPSRSLLLALLDFVGLASGAGPTGNGARRALGISDVRRGHLVHVGHGRAQLVSPAVSRPQGGALARAAKAEELPAAAGIKTEPIGGSLGPWIAATPASAAKHALGLANFSVVGRVLGGSPLPDIASQVQQAAFGRAGGKTAYRRCLGPSVVECVHRGYAGKPLRHQIAAAIRTTGIEARRIRRLVSPRKNMVIAVACGEFPFLFCWQTLARPGAKGLRLVKVDAVDRMTRPPLRMQPIAKYAVVAALVEKRVRRAARSSAHTFGVSSYRHFGAVEEKWCDGGSANGLFVFTGFGASAAHEKRTAQNRDHVRGRACVSASAAAGTRRSQHGRGNDKASGAHGLHDSTWAGDPSHLRVPRLRLTAEVRSTNWL